MWDVAYLLNNDHVQELVQETQCRDSCLFLTFALRCRFITNLTEEETEVESFVQAPLLLNDKGKINNQDYLMSKIIFFFINSAEQLAVHMQKNQVGLLLHTIQKNYLKMDH